MLKIKFYPNPTYKIKKNQLKVLGLVNFVGLDEISLDRIIMIQSHRWRRTDQRGIIREGIGI